MPRAIRRLFAMLAIMRRDIEISDLTDLILSSDSESEALRLILRREKARALRDAARSEYNTLLPVGHRRTWGAV